MSTERKIDLAREIRTYGMTAAEVREEYGNSLTARFVGVEMVVMSILSDSQEMLAAYSGDLGITGRAHETVRETVRQQLNVAKLLLSDLHVKNQERLHKEAAR